MVKNGDKHENTRRGHPIKEFHSPGTLPSRKFSTVLDHFGLSFRPVAQFNLQGRLQKRLRHTRYEPHGAKKASTSPAGPVFPGLYDATACGSQPLLSETVRVIVSVPATKPVAAFALQTLLIPEHTNQITERKTLTRIAVRKREAPNLRKMPINHSRDVQNVRRHRQCKTIVRRSGRRGFSCP